MEKLKNCPNCGGYLNDSGRCEFCGSKVYDFVNVDFDKNTKTYIRVRHGGQIVLLPVIFSTYRHNTMSGSVDTSLLADSGWHYICPKVQDEKSVTGHCTKCRDYDKYETEDK